MVLRQDGIGWGVVGVGLQRELLWLPGTSSCSWQLMNWND
jgi:hypothetical protein